MKKVVSSILVFVTVISTICAFPFTAEAKKTYDSYSAVIEDYYGYEGRLMDEYDECNCCCYNYLKIKTPYGMQKALIIYIAASLCQETHIYIKRPTGEVVRYKKLKGALIKYNKKRNYFLTQEHVSTGTDVLRLYRYSPKKKKYIKKTSGHTQYGSRFKYEITFEQAIKNINKKAKVNTNKFKNFRFDKYTVF